MSTPELITMQFALLLAFYITAYLTHPARIFGFIKSILSGNEETQLDQLIRTKMDRIIKSAYRHLAKKIYRRWLRLNFSFTSKNEHSSAKAFQPLDPFSDDSSLGSGLNNR